MATKKLILLRRSRLTSLKQLRRETNRIVSRRTDWKPEDGQEASFGCVTKCACFFRRKQSCGHEAAAPGDHELDDSPSLSCRTLRPTKAGGAVESCPEAERAVGALSRLALTAAALFPVRRTQQTHASVVYEAARTRVAFRVSPISAVAVVSLIWRTSLKPHSRSCTVQKTRKG